MSVRPPIAMFLLSVCVLATGCSTSPEPKGETENSATKAAKNMAEVEKQLAEDKAAADKRAAEDKAAADKKAEEEKTAAAKKIAKDKATAEKTAAQEKAAANSSLKVKVEVELRGVLSFNEQAVTITITERFDTFTGFVRNGDDIQAKTEPSFSEVKWELDLREDKELRTKAKGLNGKTVLANGSATLRGIKSHSEIEFRRRTERELELEGALGKGSPREVSDVRTTSVLDLEPKLTVKSLVEAPKK